jgi:lipopolysaccharide transport system ATP-binding protein
VDRQQERVWREPSTAPGNERIRLHHGRVVPEGTTNDAAGITVHTPFAVEVEYWDMRGDLQLVPTLNVYTERGILVFSAGPPYGGAGARATAPGARHREVCHVPGDLLNDGVHRIELIIMQGSELVYQDSDFLFFTVRDSAELRDGWFGKWPGAVRPRLRWVSEIVGAAPQGS